MKHSFDDLFVFVKVVEYDSIAATAKYFGISYSTVFRKIKTLEETLGYELFILDSKSSILTKKGRDLFEKLRDTFDVLGDIDLCAEEEASEVEISGNLKVMLPADLAYELIAALLPAFCMKYPLINLSVYYNHREFNILDSFVDVALINYMPKIQYLKVKKVYTAYAKLYCTKAYALKYGVPQHPSELDKHFVTGYLFHHQAIKSNMRLYNRKTQEEQMVKMLSRFASNRSLCNAKMLESNEIICGVMDFVDLSYMGDNLIEVLPDWESAIIDYYLLKNPYSNNVVTAIFYDFLEDFFKNYAQK